MTKIAFIGAGSIVFTQELLGAILSYPELHGSTIALHDLDSRIGLFPATTDHGGQIYSVDGRCSDQHPAAHFGVLHRSEAVHPGHCPDRHQAVTVRSLGLVIINEGHEQH